jgi:hypothetical protein
MGVNGAQQGNRRGGGFTLYHEISMYLTSQLTKIPYLLYSLLFAADIHCIKINKDHLPLLFAVV